MMPTHRANIGWDFLSRVWRKSWQSMLTADAVAGVMASRYAHDRSLFGLWEQHGFHVLPVHFYSPVPQLAKLPADLWSKRSELPGIDLRDQAQVRLLAEFKSAFKHEYDAFNRPPTANPACFYIGNPMFSSVDAEILFCMIRHHKPTLLIEVGSGFSTLAAAAAARKNAAEGSPLEIQSIEPFPPDFLESMPTDHWSLVRKPVQEIGLADFSELRANDILFVDSSHVVKTGSDVLYLYLDVFPRLRPGVIVHVHDIFLPLDYPTEWVHGEHRFWSEQYLLQAFLAFNHEFEILWAGSYMRTQHDDLLAAAFASYGPESSPGSLWMRRKL
jgi:hypothetical protein